MKITEFGVHLRQIEELFVSGGLLLDFARGAEPHPLTENPLLRFERANNLRSGSFPERRGSEPDCRL